MKHNNANAEQQVAQSQQKMIYTSHQMTTLYHDCSCKSNGEIINFREKIVFFAELPAAGRQPLYFSSPLAPRP
jgi:hypothetical protein